MAVLIGTPRAKKDHRCDRCRKPIPAGTHYKRYAITPGSDIGNEKWMSGREHLTEGECYYEASLLEPGEVNSCAVDDVADRDSAEEEGAAALVIYCACGTTVPVLVPVGGERNLTVEVAFAKHKSERTTATTGEESSQ